MSAIATKLAQGFLSKHWKKIVAFIVSVIISVLILIMVIVAVIASFFQQSSTMGSYGTGQVPQAVKQYESAITEELKKYGREDQINVVLAITTQESGGTASKDIMQASESLGLAPNTIQDPNYSIEVGVRYFDQVLTEAENAGVDVDTAIQSYNMGSGYIDFVSNNGGKHSKELAQQFSNQMKSQLGWGVYGDPNYVDHVKRYMGGATNGNAVVVTGEGDLQHPYAGNDPSSYITTSEFGYRSDPYSGVSTLHAGIDLAPMGSANLPIGVAEKGVVILNTYHFSGGNMMYVQHENGLVTAYLHMVTRPAVSVGETVEKGQIIGHTGTTGKSTGVHLHFEVHEGRGNQVNPRKYVEF